LTRYEEVQGRSAPILLKGIENDCMQSILWQNYLMQIWKNTETQVWLDFALSCKYISKEVYDTLLEDSLEVGKLLGYMIQNPEKFRNK